MGERFSKFLSFLGRGARLAASLHPAIGMINAILPGDRQLPEGAGPEEVKAAYLGLSPAERERLDAEAELADIEASRDKLEAMVSVESAGSNTRPFIAKLMACTVTGQAVALFGLWYTAVLLGNQAILGQIAGSWELVAALMALPAAVVRAYMGMRTREKRARYAAATGQDIGAAVGGLAQAVKSVLGR